MRSLVLILLFLFPQSVPRTARDYYNELYKAGGLDRSAAERVCFDEDIANENFFIFSQSELMREWMMLKGTFEKLSKSEQAILEEDFLVVRGYGKGIPSIQNETYDKDGASWISGVYRLDEKNSMRIRLTINWQTLRYKRAVEILEYDRYKSEVARFGKCEWVPRDVPQTAE